jgi:dTDP-4-amino-4,6-dideoxygalactose transaminase
MEFIPFHRPTFSKRTVEKLEKTLNSGWVTTGPKVQALEKRISEYTGIKNIVALNSCTAALHLTLAANGIGRGDYFIAPTYTFVASVEVGEYLGATPILVDSNPGDFNLNLDQVEQMLIENRNKSIRAIVPVHFGGNIVDMDRVKRIAKKYNLFILEDAAHSFEAVSQSRHLDKKGQAVAFSFYANKNITTGGEGGALGTNDDILAEKIRRLSLHGISKDGWNRFKKGGKWRYDVSMLGYKYNMTDVSATIGLEQMEFVDEWLTARKKIVETYCRGLAGINGVGIPSEYLITKRHSYHLFIIIIKGGHWSITRNEIIDKLFEHGIATSVHYIPVHIHSYYQKKYQYLPEYYPIATQYSETVISLPLFPSLSKPELDYIIEIMNDLWIKFKA